MAHFPWSALIGPLIAGAIGEIYLRWKRGRKVISLQQDRDGVWVPDLKLKRFERVFRYTMVLGGLAFIVLSYFLVMSLPN